MDNCQPLVLFGIVVVLIVGGFIAIPFLRRKADLLTAWNTLLFGLLIFMGLGSIEVKFVPELPWEQVQWFQPSVKEVNWYMLASAVFIATLIPAYYFNTFAKRFAQKRLQKWPPMTAPVTFFVLGSCLGIALISLVAGNVTFIGPATFKLGSKATVFAGVFSFALWHRNRLNVTWLLVFVATMLIASLYAMLVSPGRRLLLGVYFGPLLYLYWVQVRHWKSSRIIISIAITGVILLSISAVYAKFRWYNLAESQKRSVHGIVERLRDLQQKGDLFSMLVMNRINYFSQSNAHFALLTERYIAQGALKPAPLNTLTYLASFPIPRKVWPTKPEVLGLIITRDIARIPSTNWGCGIAGQGAYEGGIPALMLYAVLLTFFIRFFDEPLKLQPSNPFLVSISAGALPHIVAIPRGDLGTMITESAECVVLAVILGLIGRALFGTENRALTADATNSRYQHSSAAAYRLAQMRQEDT